GYRTSFAAGVTSGFWAAMTVGRLLVVPVSRVVPAGRIVLAACVLLLAVLTLTALPAAAPAAYVAAGLAAAPVFPVGLAWVGAAFPAVLSALAAGTLLVFLAIWRVAAE